jgi:hypothetical protein
MATGTTTQWAVGTGFDYQYVDGYVDCVFRNNYLLGMLHPATRQPVFPALEVGDSNYRWKAQSAGNTSVAVFTESASAPTPVAQTYVNAAVSYTYFWGWIRVSGHIRDIMRNSAYAGLPLIANEFISTTEDIRDLMNTSFMGSSYSGLEVSIDSGTTYAGIARGSAGYWESTETAVGGALTKASLANAMEGAEDNDKGGKISLLLAPRNQLTNYGTFAGTPNTQNHNFRATVGDLRAGFDIEAPTTSLSFQGVPIVGVPDMTNTIWLGLDLRQTEVGPNFGLSTRREFEIRGPVISGDDDVWEVSSAAALICHKPKLCWKNTGVTA